MLRNKVLGAALAAVAVATGSYAAAAQTTAPVPVRAEIRLDSTVADFGTVAYGFSGTREITFKNIGNMPLVISGDIGSSCGCITVSVPTDPIQPGKTGRLIVNLGPTAAGALSKPVTITANVPGGSFIFSVRATILAEGVAVPTPTPAPATPQTKQKSSTTTKKAKG